MRDQSGFTDHRMIAAQSTGCRQASQRGYDLRPYEEPPIWLQALAEVIRPRSIIVLAILAGCISLFWIT